MRSKIRQPEPGRARWLLSKRILLPTLLLLTLTLAGSILAMWGQSRPRHRLGEVMPETRVARVSFDAVDQEQSLANAADARDREPAVYVPNTAFLDRVRDHLMALEPLAEHASVDAIPADVRTRFHLDAPALAALREHIQQAKQAPGASGRARQSWAELTDQFVYEGLAGIAVLAPAREEVETAPTDRAPSIVIRHPARPGELRRYDNALINAEDDRAALEQQLLSFLGNRGLKSELKQVFVAAVMSQLQPTYVLDEEATRKRRQARFDEEPEVRVLKQPNDLLVRAGQELTRLDLQLLERERDAYAMDLGQLRYVRQAGLVGLVLIIGLALWTYLAAFAPAIVRNPLRGLSVTAMILLGQFIAVGVAHVRPDAVLFGAVFASLLVSTVLCLVYDRRTALALGVILTALIMVSVDLTFLHALVPITALAAALSRLDGVRSRSTLVIVGVVGGAAGGLATALVLSLLRPEAWTGPFPPRALIDVLLVVGAGVAVGLIVQGVLPALEPLFRMTTSMTLRELNDASHPLLRQLAHDAPGTYQHSLRIADMAEAAAEEIGADPILCRTGAMYHDIGKINKPSYFVENQGGGPNRHNKLSPAMSLLIIVGHVKDGIEMAREYNLPRAIRHCIEAHHGTTLVEYFYHAAKQQSAEREGHPGASPASGPTEFEFRYPGPKPQTREAAILMVCDGVEGAARTLADPTPARIGQLVHAMAMKRLLDGQFDECHLTLRELHHIEEAVTKVLCAIYHGRIAYPNDSVKPSPEREIVGGHAHAPQPASAAS